MDTETDEQRQQEADQVKLSQAFMLRRYQPTSGRADRMATNIPGGSQSSWGTNGGHTIGHGGSN
jgi:hypothetical protein